MFCITGIMKALGEMAEISVPEFERLAQENSWSLARPVDGLVEAQADYPVVFDSIIQPPIILCPFWSAEDHPRPEWRKELRARFEQVLEEVSAEYRSADDHREWGKASWAYALWSGRGVVVSVEETNYEDARVPLLVVACSSREGYESEPPRGLTARCFSAPDDAD